MGTPKSNSSNLISSLLPKLEKAHKSLVESIPKEVRKNRYVFKKGILVLEPYGPWRQGGPLELTDPENKKHKYVSLMAMPLPINDRIKLVPILSGNSITGGMKHMLSEYMFQYYYNNNRDVLYKIYRDNQEGVLAASLFRMLPPFLSLDDKIHPILPKIAWSNNIWTQWGIGLASWCPQKKLVFTHAVPPIEGYKVLEKKLKPFKDGKDFKIEIDEIKLNELSERVVKVRAKDSDVAYVLADKLVKLRNALVRDYGRLGIEIDKDKMKLDVGDDENKTEASGDFTRPIPVFYIIAAPVQLISFPSLLTRVAVFNKFEISTIASALYNISYFGPKDNIGMNIIAYLEFEDPVSGEKIVLKYDKDGGIEEGMEIRSIFEEWVQNIDYGDVLYPFAEAVYRIHKKNKETGKSKKNKKKGE